MYPPYEYPSYAHFIAYYTYLGIGKASILPVKRTYLESAVNSTPLYVKSFYRHREPRCSYRHREPRYSYRYSEVIFTIGKVIPLFE
jgi:hypothetical protein